MYGIEDLDLSCEYETPDICQCPICGDEAWLFYDFIDCDSCGTLDSESVEYLAIARDINFEFDVAELERIEIQFPEDFI